MRRQIDWPAIERAFLTGKASIRQIAAQHGVHEKSIREKAQKEGWTRGAQPPRRPDELLSQAEAERLKENYLARLRELEYRLKSGALVDGSAVEKAAFERGRIERDAWQNWPMRIAPMMAADLGIDPVKLATILEKHVRDHLAERAGAEPERSGA